MKSILFGMSLISLGSLVVSLLAAAVILVRWFNQSVPVLSNEKAAFYILWVLGLAMSILAGLRDYPDGKFNIPGLLMTPLMVGGFVAFGLLVVMLFRIRLPWVSSYTNAFTLLAGIIAAKWVLTQLNLLIQMWSK